MAGLVPAIFVFSFLHRPPSRVMTVAVVMPAKAGHPAVSVGALSADLIDPNCQTATSLFLGRMSGRRTGVHFAWTCSAILAAGFPRECQIFFSICSRKAGAVSLLPKEGAERRKAQLRSGGSRRGNRGPIRRPVAPDGAPLGVIRWWDPSAPPDRQGSLGPDRHPSDATEDSIRSPFSGLGGLLHTSPGNRSAKTCARGAVPIHIQFRLQDAPQANGDMSAILMRPGSVKTKI
jgi:hypothetical protein